MVKIIRFYEVFSFCSGLGPNSLVVTTEIGDYSLFCVSDFSQYLKVCSKETSNTFDIVLSVSLSFVKLSQGPKRNHVNRIIEHKSLLCVSLHICISLTKPHKRHTKVHKPPSILQFSTHFHLFSHIFMDWHWYITFMITLLLHFFSFPLAYLISFPCFLCVTEAKRGNK